MFKPSFIVVTSVLVVMTLMACARQLFLGFVPPATSNRLAGSKEGFLESAGHFPINWHIVSDGAFFLAGRSKKPILLVIGVHGGPLANDLDHAIFSDTDIAQFVSQNFFCIRIDGFEHPEWLNSLLPFTRVRRGIPPNLQMYVLDSGGRVLSVIVNRVALGSIDKQEIYRELAQSRNKYDNLEIGGAKPSVARDQQQVDLDLLGSQTGAANPGLSGFTALLEERCDPNHGGFPHGDIQALYPNVWRYLSLTGNLTLFKSSLDPLLLSPIQDIQEGGFFQLGSSLDARKIEFEKNSCQNSEMMLALAIQGQVSGDPFYKMIAESTFDWLASESLPDRLIPASQEDDENPQGRSPRLSFPSWELRDTLSPQDQDWASDQLGLNPFRNPQMVPFVHSRNTLLDKNKRYLRVIDALRKFNTDLPKFSDTGYLDVNGHTLARMLQSARMWGDSGRIRAIEPSIKALEKFRFGDSFVHRVDDPDGRHGYLGDYLGYVDAQLQEYLANGDIKAFDDGLHALDQTIAQFRGGRPGQFNLCGSSAAMGGIGSFCVPDLCDDFSESCTAQAIRLLLSYGRLLGDTNAGGRYTDLAKKSTRLFANLATLEGPDSAAFFCAAAEISDGSYAIAVGPQAKELANALYQRRPTRFVAPAIESLRKDLQRRGAGIYLVGTSVEGPLTVDQAAERLPAYLVDRFNP